MPVVGAHRGAGRRLLLVPRRAPGSSPKRSRRRCRKVTWPSRTEVTNGTFVVIVTTIVSTVFFALMDRFWGFVTNLVYGGS